MAQTLTQTFADFFGDDDEISEIEKAASLAPFSDETKSKCEDSTAKAAQESRNEQAREEHEEK